MNDFEYENVKDSLITSKMNEYERNLRIIQKNVDESILSYSIIFYFHLEKNSKKKLSYYCRTMISRIKKIYGSYRKKYIYGKKCLTKLIILLKK